MARVALTYRDPLRYVIEQAASRGLVDAVEVVPSGYVKAGLGPLLHHRLATLGLPYSFHFVDNSLASADYPTNNKADAVATFLADFKPMLISDHLTAHRADDYDLDCNLPVVCTPGAVDVYAENIRSFTETVSPSCPFLIEHVPAYYRHTASTLDEHTTFRSVVEQAECDVLLDLHNLYCDERNSGTSPEALIDALPAEKIREIHIAGGREIEGTGAYLDSHDETVPERVFELLERVLARANPDLIVLEREHAYGEPDQLFRDLERIHAIAH